MISTISAGIMVTILAAILYRIRTLRMGYDDPVGELSRDCQQLINQISELDRKRQFDIHAMSEEFRRDSVRGDLEAMRQHRVNLGIILSSLQ